MIQRNDEKIRKSFLGQALSNDNVAPQHSRHCFKQNDDRVNTKNVAGQQQTTSQKNKNNPQSALNSGGKF